MSVRTEKELETMSGFAHEKQQQPFWAGVKAGMFFARGSITSEQLVEYAKDYDRERGE